MAWRLRSLRQQLESHFEAARLRGQRVLDFGCGRGELTTLLASDYGAAHAVGIDLAENCLADAREALAGSPMTCGPGSSSCMSTGR